jgi:hypothetical protein
MVRAQTQPARRGLSSFGHCVAIRVNREVSALASFPLARAFDWLGGFHESR